MKATKIQRVARRHARVRSVVSGTADCPRLSVFRSNQHIHAQIIDDAKGITLAAASSAGMKMKGTKTEQAAAVGEMIAKKAAEKKISAVVFDRGGSKYHGRVKALAEAARAAGLKF